MDRTDSAGFAGRTDWAPTDSTEGCPGGDRWNQIGAPATAATERNSEDFHYGPGKCGTSCCASSRLRRANSSTDAARAGCIPRNTGAWGLDRTRKLPCPGSSECQVMILTEPDNRTERG